MLTMVDLFAGCGGLSLGLELEGFSPVFVSELNENALASYLLNRSLHSSDLMDNAFHCRDIRDVTCNPQRTSKLLDDISARHGLSVKSGDLDLVVGGPPCQGYSGIGYRRSYGVDRSSVPANFLYEEMARMIKLLNPKVFLFENVRGLLWARWTARGVKGEVFAHVLKTFRSLKNYRVEYRLVFAKDFGVPQNRPRVLIVGVRKDLPLNLWMNNPSGTPVFFPEEKVSAPDLIDLLGDLVDDDYENGGSTSHYPAAAIHRSQRSFRTTRDGRLLRKGSLITEHEYTLHSSKVIKKFTYMIKNDGQIPPSMRSKKFAQRLLPERWPSNGPSLTATSLPDDYVHFAQPRILTVREWARLQGFPDWYQFCGPRTTGGLRRAGNPRQGMFGRELPRYTQIGNAVPVELASALGRHFKKILDVTSRR